MDGGSVSAGERWLSGWGRQPRTVGSVSEPTTLAVARELIAPGHGGSLIPRGLGRAYGDSACNDHGRVVVCERLDRFRSFDPRTGLLEAEAGTSLDAIIRTFLPRGWFLPTTPGTRQVTLGGAVAADVHGKNHHHRGSFGGFVDVIELCLADGSVVRCSRDQHPDLFFATLGGMGLTGLILAVRFRLVPVPSAWINVDYRRTRDLEHTLATFAEHDARYEHSVAWIDCMARGPRLGRSIAMHGSEAAASDLPVPRRGRPWDLPVRRAHTFPFTPPCSLLSPTTVRIFNELFYHSHGSGRRVVDIHSYFYPLDGIHHWNRMYGPSGFIQYQAFFPRESSHAGLRRLLGEIVRSGAASFLAVLKSCGPADGALLSYLEPGHTLALDIPYARGTIDDLCRRLDRILLDHGGRLYLAKDAMMGPTTFRAMYPRLPEFLTVKRRYDPNHLFSSSQSRRLGIE